MPKSFLRQARVIARSSELNLDGGTTPVDAVFFNSGPSGCRLLRVYALYNQITQTVAGGSFALGTTSGGVDLVAATNYEDSKGIGVVTEATIAKSKVAPNTTVYLDHTGVVAVQTGTAFIIVEYAYDE